MEQPATPNRQEMELETWERRALFALFKGYTEPYHGVCLRVDCTGTFHYAKQHLFSVFLSLLHRSLTAANQLEHFKTRIVDDAVYRYDQIDGGSAVGRSNGTIGFGFYPFHGRLADFVRHATPELERVRQRDDIERHPHPNVIRFSVLPWFDFTSISHARDFGRPDSAPRITFGRITEAGGRCTMPVSIHVHHALVDGLQVAEFLQKFQAALDAPGEEP